MVLQQKNKVLGGALGFLSHSQSECPLSYISETSGRISRSLEVWKYWLLNYSRYCLLQVGHSKEHQQVGSVHPNARDPHEVCSSNSSAVVQASPPAQKGSQRRTQGPPGEHCRGETVMRGKHQHLLLPLAFIPQAVLHIFALTGENVSRT